MMLYGKPVVLQGIEGEGLLAVHPQTVYFIDQVPKHGSLRTRVHVNSGIVGSSGFNVLTAETVEDVIAKLWPEET